MTIYVSDTPFELVRGTLVFHLWADTSDEAQAAVYAVGADPETCRRQDLNAWEAYTITPDQFADAVGLGVTITDRFGPAIWCAERDGAHERLMTLQAGRERLRVASAPRPPR